MIIKKISFIVLLVFLLRQITYTQEVKFTPGENQNIKSEINTLLGKYEEYASFSKDGINIDPAMVNNFKGLFSSTNINVYNNLEPERPFEQNIAVNEYINKIESYYQGGLEVKLNWDVEQLSNPYSLLYAKNKYQLYLPVEIKLIGLYKGKRIHNTIESLYFVFNLKRTREGLSDFKIHAIQLIKPVFQGPKKSNIYLSLHGAPLYTKIYSKEIFNNENWSAKGETGFSFGIKLSYFFSDYFGINTGIGYSNYRTQYLLKDFDNYGTNTLQDEDEDGDIYYKYFIDTDVKEYCTLNYLDIPLGIVIKPAKERRIVPFLNFGLQISYLLSSNFNASGHSSYQGYYPYYHVVLYDLEEYGFTTRDIEENDDWKLSTFTISAFFSPGVSVSLSRSISLGLNTGIYIGLNDLRYEKAKYREDFINTTGTEPSKISTQAFGLNLFLLFKL